MDGREPVLDVAIQPVLAPLAPFLASVGTGPDAIGRGAILIGLELGGVGTGEIAAAGCPHFGGDGTLALGAGLGGGSACFALPGSARF